ncbi:MAG: hypothetical protein FWB96_08010 [Defluviitaleaceae bacterium]|nr:hypothetical protein [Defluviitaleaceae bacterium]MCL2262856.1 hypothetical protein [Defluviitaleaceae bacterium]
MKWTKETVSTEIEQYIEKITFINSCIEIYEELDVSKILFNEEVNIAPAFFGLTMSVMARTITLESSRLGLFL